MNYLIEINRFYDWLETNDIPKSAISLWHALMHVNNKTGWLLKFNVAMSVLELKTGFKSSELFKARNVLQEKQRIIWTPRGGNLSANYQIISFCLHEVDANSNTNSYTNENANIKTNGRQSGSIHKLKEIKLNQTLEEEEQFLNFKGITPPNDGVARNFEGLLHFLKTEISISDSDIKKIIIKSNFGEKGTPIWRAISRLRELKESKDQEKHVGFPVNYILNFK